jgi:hypothetical protein
VHDWLCWNSGRRFLGIMPDSGLSPRNVCFRRPVCHCSIKNALEPHESIPAQAIPECEVMLTVSGSFAGFRFMQSDPWWSLAMAANVYMVFFYAASPSSFRQYLWAYCIVCFGLPAIPAVICAVLRPDKGLLYGNATVNSLLVPILMRADEADDASCSCGAGLAIPTTRSVSTFTTYRSGHVSACQLLFTLQSATTYSITGTRCATCL